MAARARAFVLLCGIVLYCVVLYCIVCLGLMWLSCHSFHFFLATIARCLFGLVKAPNLVLGCYDASPWRVFCRSKERQYLQDFQFCSRRPRKHCTKTQLRYPTSAPLKTIMIKFPALRPPEALFVVLSQAPHGFVLPVYCFAKQAKNATGEYGACAHRCGGPISLRPLSPCPCNAAVPKGPTFGFFNYEDR